MAERIVVFRDCDFCVDEGVQPEPGEPLPAAFGGKPRWADACPRHREPWELLRALWERLGRLAQPGHEVAATTSARHRPHPGGANTDHDRDADGRWRCPKTCGAGPFNSRAMFRAHLRQEHKDIEGQYLMRSLARYACPDCSEVQEGHVRWWAHRKRVHGKENESLPARLDDATAPA